MRRKVTFFPSPVFLPKKILRKDISTVSEMQMVGRYTEVNWTSYLGLKKTALNRKTF